MVCPSKGKKSRYCMDFRWIIRSSHPVVFCKKGAHRNFIKFYNFIKKRDPGIGVSQWNCEISKNTFFHRTLWWLLLNHIKIHSLEMINIQRCKTRQKQPPEVFCKKGAPRNFEWNCEISKNTFFTEHLWATASGKVEYYLTKAE